MIHWCTSVEYDKYTMAFKGNERALIREGTTEWLKRNAMNDWEAGGYKDVIPRMREIIDGGAVTGEQLMHVLGRQGRAEDGRRDPRELPRGKPGQGRRSEGGGPEARARARRAAHQHQREILREPEPGWRNVVAEAFADVDDATLAAQVKNAAWLKYLRARTAGSDDAAALNAARI